MDRLIIENVRCFHGKHSARLAPLTVLVGENSSGKSTFQALLRLAWQVGEFAVARDTSFVFNEEPFMLGSYDQIATFRGGRGGRAREFAVGFVLDQVGHNDQEITCNINVVGRFVSQDGQPALKQWSMTSGPFAVTVSADRDKRLTWRFEAPSGKAELIPEGDNFIVRQGRVSDYFLLLEYWPKIVKSEGQKLTVKDREHLMRLVDETRLRRGVKPYAFAPIRTRPQRTYDPIKDTATPEGSHVPMILATLYAHNVAEWGHLKKSLNAFGHASGLFKTVEVRRLGRSESDPFQIRVHIEGPPVNLVDVGYGVSQVLPIVVDCLRGDKGTTFLLQQPEVHLHPKAQAELSSFLNALAKGSGKRFVIETHSDYLLDRVRTDVREGRLLPPQDVSVLYFERKDGGALIHSLGLDKDGNLGDVPAGHRSFFMEEERKVLGI